jgi:hypothetical protein
LKAFSGASVAGSHIHLKLPGLKYAFRLAALNQTNRGDDDALCCNAMTAD